MISGWAGAVVIVILQNSLRRTQSESEKHFEQNFRGWEFGNWAAESPTNSYIIAEFVMTELCVILELFMIVTR